MEITIFESIVKAIGEFGIVNTLIALLITLGLSYLYKNKKKSEQILQSTVEKQANATEISIDNINSTIIEIQRTSNLILESVKELTGQVTGALSVVINLVKKDIDREKGDN
jgi:uncharacterized membrane protein YkgB